MVHSSSAPSPVTPNGRNVKFDDNQRLVFGTGNDAVIYYDGTDLIIDPQDAGSGDVVVNAGNLTFAAAASITTDAGDLTLSPAGDIVCGGNRIERSVDNDDIGISGGNGPSTGANIQMTGGNNGTEVNRMLLRAGSTTRIHLNNDGIGFFAATPVAQQNVPQTSPSVQDVIDALVNLGLVEQSD